ncbi:MAG: contractile injection system tape measure protein [Chitinophagales bacterium]
MQVIVQEEISSNKDGFYSLKDALEELHKEERTKTEEQKPISQKKHSANENQTQRTLLESITYFLEFAHLPDQIEASLQGLSFEQLFTKLLEKQARNTYPILRNAARTNEAQERLILQLSPKTLLQLVQTLQPKFADFLQNFQRLISELYQQSPILFKPVSEVKTLEWQFILAHLFTIQIDEFHPTTFASEAIKHLSIEGSEHQKEFRKNLQTLIHQQIENTQSLQIISDSLIAASQLRPNLSEKQEQASQRKERLPLPKKEERTLNLVQSIAYFLLNKKLPRKVIKEIKGFSFDELLLQLLHQNPEKILFFLQKMTEELAEQEVLIQYASDDTLTQLLAEVDSNILSFLKLYPLIVNKLKAEKPSFFVEQKAPRILQWHLLIAYLLQKTSSNLEVFIIQKIEELFVGQEEKKESLLNPEIEQELQKGVVKNEATVEGEEKNIRRDKDFTLTQTLSFFLQNERLPNQVESGIEGLSFEALFTLFLQRHPHQVLPFLRARLKGDKEEKRLVRLLSEKTLQHLLQILQPNFVGFVETFRLAIQKLQKSDSSVFTSKASVEKSHWEAVIAYLLDERHTVFDTKFFVVYVIQFFAKVSGVASNELAEKMEGIVKEEVAAKQFRFYPLGEILEGIEDSQLTVDRESTSDLGLAIEQVGETEVEGSEIEGKEDLEEAEEMFKSNLVNEEIEGIKQYSLAQTLSFFLQNERLPNQVESGIEGLSFEALFTLFLQKHPHQVLPFLRARLKAAKKQKRLIRLLSENILQRLLQTLQPNFVGFMETFRLAIQKLKESDSSIFSSKAKLEESYWEGALAYLLDERHTIFDTKNFVAYAIHFFAKVSGIASSELAEKMERIVKEEVAAKQFRFYPLGEILEGMDYRRLTADGEANSDLELAIEELGEMEYEESEYEGSEIEGEGVLEEAEGMLGNNLGNEEIEDTKEYSLTQTLSFFLQNECLPNRVESGIEGLSFEALFTLFLQKHPHQVLPFLRARLKGDKEQKRLVWHLSENTLQHLLQTLQPNFTGFVETFRLAIQKLEESKSSTFTFKTSLKESHWSRTIAYLLDDKYTVFDTKTFVKYGVQSLAKVNGIDSVKLTKELQKLVKEEVAAKQFRFYPLEEILQGIDDGELTVGGKGLRNEGESTLDEAEEMLENNAANEDLEDFKEYSLTQALGFFLQNERLPNQVESAIEGLSFEALFTLFLQKHPNQVLPFLRIRLKGRTEQKRLIRFLSEKTLQYLLQTLQPNFAGFVDTFRLAIQKMQESDSSIFTSKASIENSHWDTTIAYLLDGKNTDFDTKSFVKYGVQSFSKVTQIGPEELSEKLEVVVKEEVVAKHFRFYPLEEILKTVNGEGMTTESGRKTEDDGQKIKRGKKRKSIDEKKEVEDAENRSNRELGLEDLLAYFLEHGLLPESLPRKWRGMNFGQLFAEFLEKSPQKTLPLLREEAKMNERQERLIKQLSEKILQQLQKVMAGNHAVFAESFRVLVLDLAASDGGVFKAENSSFVHWQSVIAYFVGEDKGFDRLGFLVFVIRYLSEKSNLSAEELLLRLQTKLKEREAKDGAQILKASMESLAKIAKVVFGEGEEMEEEKTAIVEAVSTPMEQELKRIGLKINEKDIFDMREAVHYLYGYKTYLKKYTKTEFEALFRELMQTYPDTTKATLVTLLGDDDVLEKILDDFSEETYQSVVSLLQPSLAKKIGQYLKDMAVMFKAGVVRRELLLYLKEIDEFSFSLMDFIHQILKVSVGEDKNEYGRILITSIQYLRMTKLASKEEFRTALSELKIKHDVRARDIKTKGPKRATSLDEKAKSNKSLLEQTVYVQNAGLVLIYPFLSRYFNYLGMLEENKFKDEETAHRGVLLLQFLATGFSESPEHELVLNKLLCGLPLNTPVPLKIEMTEKETQISEQMLQGVIQNWKRLNNMTAGNFRGSFLLREGKLEEKEKFWQLKVEKKAWDLLLKTLPWGFSIVRIPWMEKMINVEWEV